MPFISSSDVKVTLIPEDTFGVLATTGPRYDIPRKAGDSLPVKDGGNVESDTIKPGRNANGSRRGNQSVSGSLEFNAICAPFMDFLMEGAVSGKYDGNVLKAGQTDSSFSHISQLTNNEFKVSTGCVPTNFTLTATAAEAVTLSFDFSGAKQVDESAITGTHTATPVDDAAYEFLGHEVLNVTVGGSTALKFTELELSVEQSRTPRNVLSSDAPVGFAASGARAVTYNLTFYRETGVDYAALFTGDKQEFSFDLGIAGYGRRFTVYGQASIPEDVTEDDMLISVVVTGAYDSTEGTALVIEKLV